MVLGHDPFNCVFCSILFLCLCCSLLSTSYQWQLEFNTSYPNLTGFHYGNLSENIFKSVQARNPQITSALSEQLLNIAAAAGQPIPKISWITNAIKVPSSKIIPEDIKEQIPVVQRNARESESETKVTAKQAELQQLLQQLYQAEATVQMEVGEVTRAQQIATEAEQLLEEATNKVRILSSDLQAAQESAATCAMRAHTAQLQLAAHDQLMFTARQRVDALSAQMVSVQAELASVQNSFTLNESSQHLEQQGKLSNIYQIQPLLLSGGSIANGNSNITDHVDHMAAGAAAAANIVFPIHGSSDSQVNPLTTLNTNNTLRLQNKR